ncbi:MAG: DUF503 domain-containing protein [Planctomycetes bacterium]|nr:DUF503 domain-containing protein [Planctomycetota bacterium]
MVVGLLSVELHLPGAHSLKDKRMVLRGIKDRLRKFNVAVAEVGHQDLWQRAGLGIVTVATTNAHADRELAAVVDEIERVEPGLITRTEIEFLA